MNEDPEKLELRIDQLLRRQPARRAPPALQARVLAQLNARAMAHATPQGARPWWRKGFAHWPTAARVGFLLASYGFVRLALLGVMSVRAMLQTDNIAGAVSPAVSRLQAGAEVLNAIVSTGELVIRAIPAGWLYGAAACGVALYAALFGIGTVAYRTLYVNK
jgi:hypothetical protein